MKYIVLPVLRVLFAIVATLGIFPLAFLGEASIALWHWKKKPIKYLLDGFFNEFWTEDKDIKFPGETYWVYKNPIDYIRRKKTYVTKS
jgi:hypothetical protein